MLKKLPEILNVPENRYFTNTNFHSLNMELSMSSTVTFGIFYLEIILFGQTRKYSQINKNILASLCPTTSKVEESQETFV
jgi:hypothetical protein